MYSIFNSVMLSRALFTAAELNIAEHLEKKPRSLKELAALVGAHEESLERLLYFLELNDIFVKRNQYYENTKVSELLIASHPNSFKSFILHDDETRWNALGHLGYSIKTGKSSFENLYGNNYFQYITHHSVLQNRFDESMVTISQREDQLIAQKINFSGIVADIGGGKGNLLCNIRKNHPDIQAILFDLPAALESVSSTEFQKVPGSFFDHIVITADIFILKRILHDWNDEKALIILKNVAAAMHAASKLYIVEGVLDKVNNKKLLAAIDLALLAIFQGKERNNAQFNILLEGAGLELVHQHEITEVMNVLECRKKIEAAL